MSRLSVVILLAKIGKKKSLPSQQREDKQAHAVGALGDEGGLQGTERSQIRRVCRLVDVSVTGKGG